MAPETILVLVAFCGLLLGAAACLGAAAWLAGHHARYGRSGPALLATAVTAGLSMLTSALTGSGSSAAALAETIRNITLLVAIYHLFATDGRHKSVPAVRLVLVALAMVEFLEPVLLIGERAASGAAVTAFVNAQAILQLLFAVGGLVLLHNLYLGAAVATRLMLRWPASAYAAVLLFDLNFYAFSYLGGSLPIVLEAARGFIAALFAAILIFGTRAGSEQLRFKPSRTIAFQSISLVLIGAYLIALFGVAAWLDDFNAAQSARFQIAFIAAAIGLTLIVLPSRRIRGWARVTLLKHLFSHRYDYREEWLRFNRTIGQGGGQQTVPLEERVIKAVADLTDSPAGLLLRPVDGGAMGLACRWAWPMADVPGEAMPVALVGQLERQGYIVELDEQRAQRGRAELALPDWIVDDPRAWALVPLLHFDRLVGVVVLARPAMGRRLDWEDFDLFRVAGQQIASYLAEHAGQEALAEAGRFDDFNRRIAFVMHDIKNLASQLSLLARNAEMHAENPAFRADMLVTLRNSADKLNTLLARLSRYGGPVNEATGPVRADLVAARIVDQFKAVHPIELVRSDECEVAAALEPLEQALSHLVQNAVDASTAGTPVFLSVTVDGMAAHLEVVDSGAGMSPEFVRTQLFKPFVSSKSGGFGIGAYEARELVRAMHGRLDVESREGLGSRFVIRLPLAATAQLLETLNSTDKKVA